MRVLLEAGADANEAPYLIDAVRSGRGPAYLELLVAYGVDLERRDDRQGDRRRTAYEHAVLRRDAEAVATLTALGASTSNDPEDAIVAAFVRGEARVATLPRALDATQQSALALATLTGRVDEVIDLVGVNFRTAVGGSPTGSLLHHAAWHGIAPAVRTLLERGADPHAATKAEFSTPTAWAVLASRGWGEPGFNYGGAVFALPEHAGRQWWETAGVDYVDVVAQLVSVGAELEPRFLDVAYGPLADWLADRFVDLPAARRTST